MVHTTKMRYKSRPWTETVDLCLQRYVSQMRLTIFFPMPLCNIIEDFAREALTDTTIRDAVKNWCESEIDVQADNSMVIEQKKKRRDAVIMRFGHILHWDVGKVTNMSELFKGR